VYGIGYSLSRVRAGVAVAIIVALMLGVAWYRTHPPGQHTGEAYEAAQTYVRNVSAGKDLLFPMLGLDPGATCKLLPDGDYRATGWVEQVNKWGHRVHRDWIVIVHHQSGHQWNCVYIKLDRFTFGTDIEK
jgi:hypothetical protein